MMKLPYTKNNTISYFEIDQKNKLSLPRIPEILQDVAVKHSDSVGLDLDYLYEHNYGWIITSWHIVIVNMPKEGDKTTIDTWYRKYRRSQVQRSYEMKDENGQLMCYAESKWFLLDKSKRRPTKVPKGLLELYGDFDKGSKYSHPIIEDETFILPKPSEFILEHARTFKVTRRDIDTNYHVNNIAYIWWAVDDIDEDLFQNKEVSDMKVAYIKECRQNETVISKLSKRLLDDNRVETMSEFYSAEDEEKVFCRVVMIWE